MDLKQLVSRISAAWAVLTAQTEISTATSARALRAGIALDYLTEIEPSPNENPEFKVGGTD